MAELAEFQLMDEEDAADAEADGEKVEEDDFVRPKGKSHPTNIRYVFVRGIRFLVLVGYGGNWVH